MTARGGASARRLLVAGALAGVSLAAAALLRSGSAPAPSPAAAGDAVAWVDGEPISRESLARFAGQAARERGVLELDDAARAALLERLIDEELLLREGLALGLARREPTARRAIVSAMVEGVAAAGGEPDRASLEALYAETREEWRRPGAVELEAAFARVPPGAAPDEEAAARERIAALAARVRAGGSLAALAQAEGLAPVPPLPPGPIAREVLRGRFAGSALEALDALAPGEVSEPVRSGEGWWLVRLVARGPDEALPPGAILPELRARWIAREHERALREHLAALRARAEIRYAEPPAAR